MKIGLQCDKSSVTDIGSKPSPSLETSFVMFAVAGEFQGNYNLDHTLQHKKMRTRPNKDSYIKDLL